MSFKKRLLLTSLITTISSASPKKLLLIETNNNPLYNYKSLKQLTEQAGFETACVHFYNMPEQLDQYDAIFLLMSNYFFEHTFKANFFTNVINQLIKYDAINKQKIVGLVFPRDTNDKNFASVTRLLAKWDLYHYSHGNSIKFFFWSLQNHTQVATQQFITNFLRTFVQPSYLRSTAYNTALYYKNMVRQEKILPITFTPTSQAYTLPTQLASQFTPMGLVIDQGDTKFFISKMSWLDINEINEDFRVNPIEQNMKYEFISTAQATLCELHRLLEPNKNISCNIPHKSSSDPSLEEKKKHQALRHNAMNQRYAWADHSAINAGWLEIEAYTKNAKSLYDGVASILDARLNLLWMSLNPEQFLSPLVKGKEKETAYFLRNVSIFTQKLKQQCADQQQQIPHIFVGFDITTNYRRKPVKNTVVDIMGKELNKIPAPLDWDHFWKPEFLQPFNSFIEYWENGYGNGLPIAGIFLDLEMYHAQNQASEYTNMMDFGDHSWQLYCKKYPEGKKFKTAKQRVNYLLMNHKISEYYAYLQQKAYELGKKIRENIRTRLPETMIGVYTMTLPHSWFSLGFLAGLSTPQDPIILATFNNDAYSHFDYLLQNGIYSFHIPVILLSKLRSTEDFSLINQLRTYHDGVWFNRFSRLVEKLEPDSWWQLEASPLERDIVAKGIGAALNNF
jgi:hypothetical protein